MGVGVEGGKIRVAYFLRYQGASGILDGGEP